MISNFKTICKKLSEYLKPLILVIRLQNNYCEFTTRNSNAYFVQKKTALNFDCQDFRFTNSKNRGEMRTS